MEKEQVANYRISKPRRVLDNTFGICGYVLSDLEF